MKQDIEEIMKKAQEEKLKRIEDAEVVFKNGDARIMDYDAENAQFENIIGIQTSLMLRNEEKIIRFMLCGEEGVEMEDGCDLFPPSYQYIIIEEDLQGNRLRTYKIKYSMGEDERKIDTPSGDDFDPDHPF